MKQFIRTKKVRGNIKLLLIGIGIVTIFALSLGCSKSESKSASQNQSTGVETKSKTSTGSKTQITYSADIKPILDQNCVGCHNPNGSVSSIPLNSYASVTNDIKFADPENSELVKAVDGGKMNGRLNASQIELLKNWIKQGSKE